MIDNAFPLFTLTGIWHTELYVSESRKDLQISTQVVFNSTEFTVLIAWAAPWQHEVTLPYSVRVFVCLIMEHKGQCAYES